MKQPNQPPKGVENLSWYRGYIEGQAERLREKHHNEKCGQGPGKKHFIRVQMQKKSYSLDESVKIRF